MSSTRKYSKKQEEYVAETLSLHRTPNSGATTHKKGDCTDELFMIECKTLTKEQDQQTLHLDEFHKIRREMIESGKDMAGLAFDFGRIGKPRDTFIAFSIDDARILMELYREHILEE